MLCCHHVRLGPALIFIVLLSLSSLSTIFVSTQQPPAADSSIEGRENVRAPALSSNQLFVPSAAKNPPSVVGIDPSAVKTAVEGENDDKLRPAAAGGGRGGGSAITKSPPPLPTTTTTTTTTTVGPPPQPVPPPPGSPPTCIWYGVCNSKPHKLYQNCLNYTRPVPLRKPSAIERLRQLCPNFVNGLTKDNPYPEVCCDEEQLINLEDNMGVPKQMLNRCPACYRNFVELWCQSTCSPRQSQFLTVTDSKLSKTSNKWYVNGLEYNVNERFTKDMFKYCKNVQFPGGNQPALDILCGQRDCTASKWLRYLGKENPRLPFVIDFSLANYTRKMISGRTVVPMNETTFRCNEAIDSSTLPCSCQDCEQSCFPVPPYPKPHEGSCRVGQIDCLVFVSLLAFGGLCLTMILMFAFHYICYTNGTDVQYQKDYRKGASYLGPLSPKNEPITEFDFWEEGMISDEDVSICENVGAWLERKLEDGFVRWGIITTRHPFLVGMFGLSVAVLASLGLAKMEFTTDPVKLWSNPDSNARIQKDYFDTKFGPFYRTEQMIITPTNQAPVIGEDKKTFEPIEYGPVFRKEFLAEVLKLQNNLAALTATYGIGENGENQTVRLEDICYQPLAPQITNCTIMSALNWFQNDMRHLMLEREDPEEYTLFDYIDHIKSCAKGPTQVDDQTVLHLSCLGTYGGPIQPFIALGGFPADDYSKATALVITFVVNNNLDKAQNAKAKAWEAKLDRTFWFIEYLRDHKSPNFTVSYMAERSIQDEIVRGSESDVITILISYLFMFGYIVFALGQYNVYRNNLGYLLVQSKIVLGVCGTIIVLLSVTSSIGIYAFCGIPATMIVLEVQPFLVLAVGVDNIFIFVQAYQRDKGSKERSLEERMGQMSGEVIPSMLLSSMAECVCFFLGALSTMPAVKVFSLYAALAIFFDFFLQITCFLAVFTLDVRREESGRMEPCCYPRLEPQSNDSEGYLYTIFRQYYTPFLLWEPVRYAVVVIFFGWLCSSLAVIDKIELGLDQKLSMPRDSYVLRYFEAMDDYLSVGPPVYFVVKGEMDYSDTKMQNMICGSAGCDQESLYGQIYAAAHWSNRSYIAQPVTSWLDDYFSWLLPAGKPNCCRHYPNETFCPSTSDSTECKNCNVQLKQGRPPPEDFNRYLSDFLVDNPGLKCAKGGHAAYADALAFTKGKKNGSHQVVEASYFMTYHSVLKTSADYIAALENADMISRKLTESLNRNLTPGEENRVEVFAYSIFYVFYEQYLTLVRDATLQLILSVGSIFVVTSILLGLDPWSGAMITVTIILILLNLMGMMHWWNITFNAISLVNLVMAVGISVESCSHIVRQFSLSVQPTRVDRARDALTAMGSSVLSGITLTNAGGIIVLAFSHSQIFQVFYFRMYFGIMLIGALHGLVFLPVLLSFCGPSVNKGRLLARQRTEQLLMQGANNIGAATLSRNPHSNDALISQACCPPTIGTVESSPSPAVVNVLNNDNSKQNDKVVIVQGSNEDIVQIQKQPTTTSHHHTESKVNSKSHLIPQ